MPNITRGRDTTDLVRYLFGPGRRNEHTDPHLVATSDGMTFTPGQRLPKADEQKALADEIDTPHALHGTEVRDGHVWHCSLAVKAEEGRLPDEQWQRIAHRMVDEMGFSTSTGRSPCRWIAVHHGLSINGNDHIHLVVDLVREDGTKADVWMDMPRAQRACAAIEREFGLRVTEGRATGRTMPGIKPGEAEHAARRGRPEPERRTLARQIRLAAAAAGNEEEFVRAARARGLLVRARYTRGGRTEAAGYSVALRPPPGARPVWFGGGKLARDLTLSRLRERWPANDAAAAAEEWRRRNSTRPLEHLGTVQQRNAQAWEEAARQVAAARRRHASIPAADTGEWCRAADELAATFAAWSARSEETPGPLAHAADLLARSAQLPRGARHHPVRATSAHTREVVMVILYGSGGPRSMAGQLAMLQQMRNGMKAVHDMHAAREELATAQALETSARGDLARLQRARQVMAASPGALPGGGSAAPNKGAAHGDALGY